MLKIVQALYKYNINKVRTYNPLLFWIFLDEGIRNCIEIYENRILEDKNSATARNLIFWWLGEFGRNQRKITIQREWIPKEIQNNKHGNKHKQGRIKWKSITTS